MRPKEGAFYVWMVKEVQQLLSEPVPGATEPLTSGQLLMKHYGLTEAGNISPSQVRTLEDGEGVLKPGGEGDSLSQGPFSSGPQGGAARPECADCPLFSGTDRCPLRPGRGGRADLAQYGAGEALPGPETSAEAAPGQQDAGFLERWGGRA